MVVASAKKTTYTRYKTSSVALLKHFRETALEKITPEEVECFKTTRAREYRPCEVMASESKQPSVCVSPQ